MKRPIDVGEYDRVTFSKNFVLEDSKGAGQMVCRIFIFFLTLVCATRISTATQLTKLFYGYSSPESALVLAVGKDKGLFEKHGIDLQLIQIRGGSIITQALIGGSIQIANATTPPYLAKVGGVHLTFIACNGSTIKIALAAQKGIKKIEQLKGKTLGSQTLGGRVDFLSQLLLRKAGLDPKRDVKMLVTGGPADRLIAMKNGITDATVLSAGFLVQAQKAGFEIIDAPASPFLREPMFVAPAFLKSHEERVTAFLKGLVESIWYFLNRKEESMRIIARFLKTSDADVLEESYRDLESIMDRKPYPTEEAIRNLFQMVLQSEPKAKTIDPMELWDLTLLRRLDESGFIDALWKR
jgi:NitT/TauT family transport system substrate-binding protein